MKEKQIIQIKPDPAFKEWAVSFSGMHGGNIKAPIWFCGIEWGGNEDWAEKNSNKQPNFKPKKQPPCLSDDKKREKEITYQFNWRMIKLYCAITGKDVSDYKKIYNEERLLDKDSNLFHLNLYPISFPGEDESYWTIQHYMATGFLSKSLYKLWCQKNRFPKLKKWMKENNPKIIVGFAINYLADFLLAFDEDDRLFEDLYEENINDHKIYFKKVNSNKTMLFVIPFLGRQLKKDGDLKLIGQEISNIYKNNFGQKII